MASLIEATPLFEKRTVAELSETELLNIDGGSTQLTVTTPLPVLGAGVGLVYAGYQFGNWLYNVTH